MTTTTLSRDDQYRLVYAGICAVASNCDGAVSEDGVGFNGQDTKFGKRIAMVPFEAWTDDVKEEAARISLTYKQQILAYTGVDMFTLEVVKDATGHGTNHQARDDARSYERQGGFHITLNAGVLEFRFNYNPVLSDELKRHTMGARWMPAPDKFWAVPADRQLPGFVAWVRDPALKFRISPEAQTALDEIAGRKVEQVRTVVESKPRVFMISTEVVINLGGVSNWGEAKDAVKMAGARYEASDKTWRVKSTHEAAPIVVAAAERVGLKVAQEVKVALGGAQKAVEAALTQAEMLLRVSGTSRPDELPAEFVALVEKKLAR